MTTALRSNQTTALSAPGDALQVSARMSVFLAEELLPLMAGLWPASANQLDSNARGVALAWEVCSGASTPADPRGGAAAWEDADWQFAPRPAEVRGVILRNNPVPVLRQLAARCLYGYVRWRRRWSILRDRAVPADSLAWELKQVLAEKVRQGATITGAGLVCSGAAGFRVDSAPLGVLPRNGATGASFKALFKRRKTPA